MSAPWHVMLDLETLGTGEDAAVLEIGMVAFKLLPDGAGVTGERFFRKVGIRGTDQARKIDGDTLAWWMGRWREAGIVPLPDGEVLTVALLDAVGFLKQFSGQDFRLWSRGHFDAPIMGHALRQAGLEVPWKFWQVCDVRTVLWWEGVARCAEVAHSALDDALRQAVELIGAWGARAEWKRLGEGFKRAEDKAMLAERGGETQDFKTQDARLEQARIGTVTGREADGVCAGKGGGL